MKTKFTKGEWIARENSSYWEVKRKDNPVGDICAVFECEQKPPITKIQQKANAKLIAAAPEMLDLLIEIVDELKDNYILGDDPFYQRLEEADLIIKKATS